VPLHLPLDRPGGEQREPSRRNRYPTDDEIDHGSGPADDAEDIGGNCVIVIDLA